MNLHEAMSLDQAPTFGPTVRVQVIRECDGHVIECQLPRPDDAVGLHTRLFTSRGNLKDEIHSIYAEMRVACGGPVRAVDLDWVFCSEPGRGIPRYGCSPIRVTFPPIFQEQHLKNCRFSPIPMYPREVGKHSIRAWRAWRVHFEDGGLPSGAQIRIVKDAWLVSMVQSTRWDGPVLIADKTPDFTQLVDVDADDFGAQQGKYAVHSAEYNVDRHVVIVGTTDWHGVYALKDPMDLNELRISESCLVMSGWVKLYGKQVVECDLGYRADRAMITELHLEGVYDRLFGTLRFDDSVILQYWPQIKPLLERRYGVEIK